MFDKLTFTLCLFFSCATIALFGQNSQKENSDILLAHLNTSHQILAKAPEVIVAYEEGKIYLDESQIHEMNDGIVLYLHDREKLSIPSVYRDTRGIYLMALGKVGNKFFKCVCNNCRFEWEGSVFDIWCPQCGSSDFSIWRNR